MLNLDNLIIEFDKGLRTLFATAPTARFEIALCSRW
jgi:hypothetical protein